MPVLQFMTNFLRSSESKFNYRHIIEHFFLKGYTPESKDTMIEKWVKILNENLIAEVFKSGNEFDMKKFTARRNAAKQKN